MSEQHPIPLDQVKQMRKLAASVSPSMDGYEKLPEGWSISKEDPGLVVSSFSTLKLKAGVVLKAYQYRAGQDGEGLVWALPEGAELPDPATCLDEDEDPVPDNALYDLMDEIEGNGSPVAYISASLLARQLSAWGSFGHGVYWETFELIGENPLHEEELEEIPIDGPTGPLDEWEWQEDPPDDWRPMVTFEDDGSVTVTFYTYCGFDFQRITCHTDRYLPGSYNPDVAEEVIATGPAGYVW